MRMISFGLTDTGRTRSNNEDFFLIDGSLLIVADGMGGAAAGEVASSHAVKTIAFLLKDAGALSEEKVMEGMRQAILKADLQIHALAEKNREFAGMGTTVVAALHCGARLLIGFVGDSRAYIISGGSNSRRNASPSSSNTGAPTVMLKKITDSVEKPNPGIIRRLTDDHSVVMGLVAAGVISENEIRSHPLRNRITKCVGSLGDLEPDFLWYDIQEGDTLILCTDGLWEMVHEEFMLAVVKSSVKPEEMCRRLISAANDAGGQDNITVITARFSAD
jgi:protein phosphatase